MYLGCYQGSQGDTTFNSLMVVSYEGVPISYAKIRRVPFNSLMVVSGSVQGQREKKGRQVRFQFFGCCFLS